MNMSTKVLPGLVLLFLAACTSSTDVVSGGGQAASKQEASAAFSAADVGEYELTTPSIDATLTLSSVAPFTFDLSAVRQTGGHNFGELADAKATIVNGEAVFEQGDDCTITIAKAGDDLDVAQEGLCTDAGFGAFVDVSGRYVRVR